VERHELRRPVLVDDDLVQRGLDHEQLGREVVDRHELHRTVVDGRRLVRAVLDHRHLGGPVLDRPQLDLTGRTQAAAAAADRKNVVPATEEVPPMRLRRPGARVGALTASLVAAAAAVQAAWWDGGPFALDTRCAAALAVVTVLFAFAEKLVITFPVRRGSHTLSLSEIPLVLGLALIHPPLLLAARLAGGLAGLTLFRGQRGSKLGFNLALYAAEVTVATAVFRLLVGGADPLTPRGWVATYAATFVTDIMSIVLVTAVIAVHDDSREWRRLLSADVRGLVQMPLVAVTTTLGLVTAVVVHDQLPAAVLLAVLALAVYRVFQRYAQQTLGHAQVEALYRFTRVLNGSRDPDQVARTVLSQVRDQVRAERAELVFDAGHAAVRMRLTGEDAVELGTIRPTGDEWWFPSRDGTPVLRADGMAVPVALPDAAGVLTVTGRLADLPAFTAEHLRLMQALAAHAGVALTNARLVDRLRHAGLHDPLTDLPNRRKLLDDLRDAIAARPDGDAVVGVLLLDLDRFKEINDALGHTVGDRVLREVGGRLRRRFGGRATVSRLGGDEFALVVPAAGGTGEVLALAQELRQSVEELIGVGDLALTTPASIGVCFAPDHGTDPDQLLQRADVAMYAAKHARAGVRVYQAADDQNTPRRLALMADLRSAIERHAIEVVYQPKVNPMTGRVVGAEALSRWTRPDGPVPPDEFIPLAERSGLIRPLTRHVLDTALAACAGWRRAGHDISVAVNLSPQMIADPTLIRDVQQALRLHGVPPTALTLEITESGIIADPTHGLLTLKSLHALGIKLSVDDFGTGHSSLGRLAELPIHEVKIDKGFVRNLTARRARRAVTDAALHLGRALDLVVVAEGVETQTEYDYLRRRGCDVVQGYFVSKPLSAAEFTGWLAGHPVPVPH
jgi:diguanylate cyclase (GGDEF)-like protein